MIEALISIVVLGICMMGISALLSQHIRRAGANNALTTAIALAERELEDIRSLEYSAMASRTSTPTAGKPSYQVTTVVVPNSPNPNEKSITTTVSWSGIYGQPTQTYTVRTVYTALQK